jgi:sugar phosphate permease
MTPRGGLPNEPSTIAPPDPVLVQNAIRRAKVRLLPFLLLMYVLSYLDRANIGYAKQAYQLSTGISDAAFALGAGVFFITYALFEVPSNLLLHRLGARVWMTRIMLTWGIIAAATAFARSEPAFITLRLMLGAAEAGFFPGAILYLTYWFPGQSRGQAMAIFYFGAPLAFTLGGPLSGSLLELHGRFGLEGWQWMFAVEGLLASIVGLWAFAYLTDRPAKANWMSAPEREALSAAMAAEEHAKQNHGAVTFRAVFRTSRLLHFAIIYFLIQTSGYGVGFYLPTQVSALLGQSVGLRVGLITAIPWTCAILAGCFWPALAIRSGYRRTGAVVSLLGITIGLALSAHLPPAWAIVALCFVTSGIITSQPIFWTFPTAYFGGIGAAAGIATINGLGNIGGFVAPTLKTWLERQFHSANLGLYFLAAAATLAAIGVAALRDSSPAPANPHGPR